MSRTLIQSMKLYKIAILLLLALSVLVKANEEKPDNPGAEEVAVIAHVEYLVNGDCRIKIINKGPTIIMANPVESEYILKFEGGASETAQIRKTGSVPIKHTIILTSGRSFYLESDAFEFIIFKDDYPRWLEPLSESNRLESIIIRMSTLDEFRNQGLTAFKRHAIPCVPAPVAEDD